MSAELPEVILTTTSSVDGRISLGRHQRLLDPAVWARWGAIAEPAPFADRHDRLDAGAILEGSGSLVDIDAIAPGWPAPSLPDDELYRDHLPHMAQRWFVVADGRGRVDWQYTGDGRRILHGACATRRSATSWWATSWSTCGRACASSASRASSAWSPTRAAR